MTNIIKEIEEIKTKLSNSSTVDNKTINDNIDNLLFRISRIEEFLSSSMEYTVIKKNPFKNTNHRNMKA